jgi:hypothetical protein
MKKTSKYLNKQFDNGWVCTHVGISCTQSKRKEDHTLAKRPGHQSYYYIFERITSDGKAEKLVRLNKNDAAKVFRGELKVEDIAEARQTRGHKTRFTNKVSYHFIGK